MPELETRGRIEPCILDEVSAEIIDLVGELIQLSERLGLKLHPKSAASLADLVRIMNCYYSNLIEGHNTTPREIERALENQLDVDDERRNLQIEARAHIRLQKEIDESFARGTLPDPCSIAFIQALHREFYIDAPDAMLIIRASDREVRMRPGVFRDGPEEDVDVGRHRPPSSEFVASFMERFAFQYRLDRLGKSASRVIAMPAAHHRFNYVHPFLDGNGRVSRLMSHAMALHAGVGAHGLWSISRGLARGLESPSEYKTMMAHADTQRQGDRDGRGNLSRRALTEFTVWYLRVCVDQIKFMTDLFDLDNLLVRFANYIKERQMRSEAMPLLEHVLLRGEVARGDAAAITGLGERLARDVLGSLVTKGLLGSDTPKGPVSIRFPVDAVETLFPALYPRT